jgi:hypothetical protein
MNKREAFLQAFSGALVLLAFVYVILASALWTLTDLGAAVFVFMVCLGVAVIIGALAAGTQGGER